MMQLGVERSRWLGELAQAIDDAQRLVWEYGSSAGLSADALDLYARLEVVRDEIETIRRARGGPPKYLNRTGFRNSDAFEPIAR